MVADQVGAQTTELDGQGMVFAKHTLHEADRAGGLRIKVFTNGVFIDDGGGGRLLGIFADFVGGFNHLAGTRELCDEGGGIETTGLEFVGIGVERVAHLADVAFLQRII